MNAKQIIAVAALAVIGTSAFAAEASRSSRPPAR